MDSIERKQQEMFERQNQALSEKLGGKVAHLKSLALDIENETKESNRYLNGMSSDFDSSEGLLSGSMKRINLMMSSGKNNRKLMCYLIAFLVVAFFILYNLISWFSR